MDSCSRAFLGVALWAALLPEIPRSEPPLPGSSGRVHQLALGPCFEGPGIDPHAPPPPPTNALNP